MEDLNMAEYSSRIDSFFYQQKTIDGGSLNNGATGRAHIGYQRSSGYCFRTTANFSNTSNIAGKPLVISKAQITLTRDDSRGTPNVKVYITSDNSSKPWELTNIIYLGEKSGTGNLTIALNNETLANFFANYQDFKILFTAEGDKTAGGRYSSATFSFNWEYGASSGEITSASPTIGKEVILKISPIVSTYSHEVEWGIIDSKGIKHSLRTDSVASGVTSSSYTYTTNNFQYFGSTSCTTTAYANLKTYSNTTEMGITSITFPLDIGNSAKPTITNAYFSPKNPSTRNGINISNAISGLYVQSLSQIYWNASCSVVAGTEIEKYNLSYTGAISGPEELKDSSTSQNSRLIDKSLTKSGTVTGTLTVTDKRGFTSEPKSLAAITVQPYKEINFSELSFKRVNKSTSEEDLITGTGIAGTATINFSSIKNGNTEKNGVKITYEIKQETNTLKSKTTISASSLSVKQTDYTISSAEVVITISAVDNFGSKINDTVIKIPSSSYIMHFKESSLGIGSAAGDSNTLTIGWKTKFSDSIELVKDLSSPLPLTSGGTESNNREGAFKKIVAPGGTITGSLDTQGTFSIKNSNVFPQMSFIPKITSAPLGKIYVYGGTNNADTVLNNSRFAFRQYSYTSNSTTVDSETYDTFLLPKTEADITSGTQNDYDILTTKNYPYVHKANGDNNGRIFSFKTFKIQTGTIYNLETSTAGAATDTTINFPESFSSIPTVVACFHAASGAAGHGNLSISVHSETTTSFTVRVNSDDSANRAPNVSWIAIGLA